MFGMMLAEAATTQPTSQPAIVEGFWNFIKSHKFLENSWLAWSQLFISILAALVISKIISMILNRYAGKFSHKKRLKTLGMFFSAISRPLTLMGLGYGLQIGGSFLYFPPEIEMFKDADGNTLREIIDSDLETLYFRICQTIITIAVIWMFFRAVAIVEHFLKGLTKKTETTLDDQFVPLLRKSLRVVVIVMGVLYIASGIYNKKISVILGGLGIGGLAVALASKDMLANMFGSVAIFTDRPFVVGERIKIKGYDGIVEEVGFRSTRLRTLDGHYVTIPNSIITNEATENVSRRPTIKRNLCIGVEYSTPVDKVQKGVDIAKQMLAERKDNFPPDRPGWVHFTEFNADNLEIRVTYWFQPADWEKFLNFNHDFNMELMKKFEAEGIEFAFPTQTLYLRNDDESSSS